jgi:hypothetical protein
VVDAGRWGDDVRISDLEPKFTCQVCFAATVAPAILDIDAMAPNITDYRLGFPDVSLHSPPFHLSPLGPR